MYFFVILLSQFFIICYFSVLKLLRTGASFTKLFRLKGTMFVRKLKQVQVESEIIHCC